MFDLIDIAMTFTLGIGCGGLVAYFAGYSSGWINACKYTGDET
tara:strand:+ start:1347 stop:1475 length:129 start_codon:yes stop_codon:yes gene_type:complete